MNYTKGEWKYHTVTGEIQSVLLGDNGFIKICDITPQDSLGRMEANAHLIAVAPEMEAVLRQFVRYCEQWQQNNGEFPNGDGRVLILKNAEQALAKTKIKEDQ